MSLLSAQQVGVEGGASLARRRHVAESPGPGTVFAHSATRETPSPTYDIFSQVGRLVGGLGRCWADSNAGNPFWRWASRNRRRS